MNMKVTPIINVAAVIGGRQALIPFYHVRITDEHEISKTVLVNYSFGEVISLEGMNEPFLEYETQIGEIKEKLFSFISDLYCEHLKVPTVIFLEGNTAENLEQQVKGNLMSAAGGSRILFVWKRMKGIEESPFYNALGLAKDGVPLEYPTAPATLTEMGYKISAPFTEVSLEDLGEAEIQIVKGDKRPKGKGKGRRK